MDEAANILTEATKRVGTTVRGKYTLERLLGVGGMAAVYRAVHRNGHRVAVKILHSSVGATPDIRTRFLREGYVANTVEHPGSVRVTDDDTADDGSVFLVMELLEGETLDALLERSGPLAPRDVAIIAWHLLDVLAAAHAKGVIHRDIKPDNVFITKTGTLKVLDFGIARLVDAFTGAAATHTGRMVGTPAFMAPEQALGQTRAIDARTDLWSVGATMFTLASQQFVHDADTVAAMVVYAGSRKARALHTVAPEFPKPLADVVDRALAFDRADRFGDAAAMQQALVASFQACFGEPLPEGPLAVATSVSSQPSLPRADALAPTVESLPGVPAATTEHAVVSERPTARRRSLLVPLLVGGLALTTVSMASVLVVTLRRATPAAAPAEKVLPPVPVASPAVTVAVSAAPTESSPPTATSAPAVVPKVTKAPAIVVHAPPTASITAAPTQHAECDPPYTIDPQGHRIPKPGCY